MRVRLWTLLYATGLLLAMRAGAQQGRGSSPSVPFYRVYQYDTPYIGWAEPTIWNSYVAQSTQTQSIYGKTMSRNGLWAHSTELEYGITDHFSLAAYLDFESPSHLSTRFIRARIEGRVRFAQRYQNSFNTALYFEYYIPDHAFEPSQEFESRVILDRDYGDYRLAINPIMSVNTTGSDAGKTSLSLASGIYYRRHYAFQPGLELYDDFGEVGRMPSFSNQRHILFATADLRFGKGAWWHLGVGVGLTGKSDTLTIKSMFTYEFDLFRPSKRFKRAQ